MRRIMEKKAAGMKAKERILAALLSTALLLSAMPVSYTHLDVYKRQVQGPF